MQRLINIHKEKECSRCHQFKPREQYNRDKSRKDGLTHLCRVCQKVRNKENKERWAFERSRGQIEVPTEKECKKCHQVKPISEFSKSNNRKDGIDYFCKICKSKHRINFISKWKKERNENKIIIKAKICNKCLKLLPISHFNKSINIKDGFDSKCRACSMELTQEYKRKWTEERNNAPSSTDEKFCPPCNRFLPVSNFYGNEYSKDGLRAYCIECELRNAELNTEKRSEERLQNEEITKEKVCNICHRMLPVPEFHKNRRYKDGLWATCIDCQKARQREYVEQWKNSRDNSDEILVAKECNVCHRTLPIKSFYPNRQYKDGYSATCTICEKHRSQEYMQRWEEKGTTIPKEKQCQACKKILSIDHFTRNKRKKDGRDYLCKDCSKQVKEQYILQWSKERDSQHKEDFSLFPKFEKTCSVCHQTKPLTMFYERKNSKDGHNASCKKCDLKRMKKHVEKQKASPKIIPKNKVCSACKQLLPASKFNNSKHRKDGLDIYCKECHNKKHKEYIAKPDVQKRMKEWKRMYHKKPEVREKERKRAREYSMRPYVKAKRVAYSKEHRARPEVKLQRQQHAKEYYKRKKMEVVNG